MTRKPLGMHPEEIKAAIRKRSGSLSSLCRQWEYSPNVISVALKNPWPAVEKLVSDFLGIPAYHIWPERYSSEGVPLRSQRVIRKNSKIKPVGNSQLEDAA